MPNPITLSDADQQLVERVWEVLLDKTAPLPLAVLTWLEQLVLQDASSERSRRRLRMFAMLAGTTGMDVTRAARLTEDACAVLERAGEIKP